MGVARDIGFRMPSIWFAEGHSAVAPVYLYRFDWATPMLRLLRLGAAHATELPYVWGNLVAGPKDPTFKLGGLKAGKAVSARIRTRWLNFATQGEPSGRRGTAWRPYREADRATLMIDKPGHRRRATSTGICGRPGVMTCSASGEGGQLRSPGEVSIVDWSQACSRTCCRRRCAIRCSSPSRSSCCC